MSISTVFSKVSGASFVGISTKTVPVLTGGKKNPMQGRIAKIMTGASVMVFQNKNSNGYENMVNRRLVAEGKNPESFVLGNRVWGVRMPNTPIIMHKEKEYLEVIFLKSGVVSYELDGVVIEKADIVGFTDKDNGEQGGLDNKVVIRTFATESITQVNIDGEKYALSV